MAEPIYATLSHLAVTLSLATTIVDGEVTAIKVWLKTPDTLADSVQFITTNNLVPEILCKAGIQDSSLFTSLVEVDSYTQGNLNVYEVTLSRPES